MKPRFIFHMLLSASLASFGLWLYMQMQHSGNAYIDSILVASYWFTFLIFLFFSWFFYWVLHKRSTKAWLIALVLAALIAIAGIIALRVVAKQYQLETEKTQTEAIQQQAPKQEEQDIVDEELSLPSSDAADVLDTDLDTDVVTEGTN